MNSPVMKTCLIVLLVVLGAAHAARSQPQDVPRLSVRCLDQASYVELAKQWAAYIDENGESAHALVNLGMARHYSGEQEAALIAARRAIAIAPDDPAALAFLAKLVREYEGDSEKALEYLRRCREIAPEYGPGLFTLVATYDIRGDWEEARDVYRTIFEQRVLAHPLQDFAYNMLIGLPEDAVLVTNGDNDTFPPLALQAGMNLRPDVAVVNWHLLNIKEYAEAVFEHYPGIKPKGAVEPDGDRSLSITLLARMIDDPNIAVYFAPSVAFGSLGLDYELTPDGLNLRSMKKGLTPEASARLFLDTYRLDSATDWDTAWDLFPNLGRMMSNYVTSMVRIAMEKGLEPDTKRLLLAKAAAIAEFHDMTRLIGIIKSLEDA